MANNSIEGIWITRGHTAWGPFDVPLVAALAKASVFKKGDSASYGRGGPKVPSSVIFTTPGSKKSAQKGISPIKVGLIAAGLAVLLIANALFYQSPSLIVKDESITNKNEASSERTAAHKPITVSNATTTPSYDHPSLNFLSNPATSSSKQADPKPSKSAIDSPAYEAASKYTPPDTTKLFRSATGQTYRVSNADYTRLAFKSSHIASLKSAIDLEEMTVNSAQEEVDRMARSLSLSKSMLNNRSQSDIDGYNYEVDRYNRKLKESRETVANFNRSVHELNAEVDAFNSDLHRVGTLSY
jgi:hypothetical protein